jgi:hypothetical protein
MTIVHDRRRFIRIAAGLALVAGTAEAFAQTPPP